MPGGGSLCANDQAVEFVRAQIDPTPWIERNALCKLSSFDVCPGSEVYGHPKEYEMPEKGWAAEVCTGLSQRTSGPGETLIIREGCTSAVLLSSLSGSPFGGGPLQGRSATEEEVGLLAFPEALVGLAVFLQPAAADEVLLVRGVRRFALVEGPPHTMRFVGVAPPDVNPTTLLCLWATRRPGPEQFLPAHVASELRAAVIGLAALQDCDRLLGSNLHCTAGLWGCGGFAGAQSVFRMLLLAAAAAITGVAITVCLPPSESSNSLKWYLGVLAEVRRKQPTVESLVSLLSSEEASRSNRLAREVPAYASFVVKRLRLGAEAAEAKGTTIAGTMSADGAAGVDTESTAGGGEASEMRPTMRGEPVPKRQKAEQTLAACST